MGRPGTDPVKDIGGGEGAKQRGENGEFPARGRIQRGQIRLPWRGKTGGLETNGDSPGDNGDKSGFHGMELFEKVGSMLWKNGTIWVPWRGKIANLTSMPWNFLRRKEKRRLPLRGAGGIG
jgi:hypothetical protein